MEGGLTLASTGKFLKSLEDLIDLSVVAPSIPPTLNDSSVFPIYNKMSPSLLIIGKIPDQASKAMASAQPMSHCLCSVCHPGIRYQALHLSPMVIAMPNSELASKKAWALWSGKG